MSRFLATTLLLLTSTSVLLTVGGCDAHVDLFQPNRVFALTLARSRGTPTEAAVADVQQVVTELFGTPDEPDWPSDMIGDDRLASIVNVDDLKRAAGPVSSDRDGLNLGLYRKNCVVCHGLSGGGTGAASLMQNPYPRDFRHGVFKWKRTERPAKPTRDDLVNLLRNGVPGTGMPSFSLLPNKDISALVDYVIYLSVRGQVERELLAAAIDELEYEESPPESPWRLTADTLTDPSNTGSETWQIVREIVVDVISEWVDAEQSVVDVPKPTVSLQSTRTVGDPDDSPNDTVSNAIERGRELFHGPIANCVACHGTDGSGQAATLDFDDWAKEYSTRIGLTPTDREAMQPFRDAGALPPRQIVPRDLRDGVLRGGDDSETIYRRIAVGIAGSPMPGIEVVRQQSGKGLTSDQIWDLVWYVRSLGEK